MSKIHRLAGVSLAAALACGLATSANAQLLQHKDLSSAIATTIALTAIDACKAAGLQRLGPRGRPERRSAGGAAPSRRRGQHIRKFLEEGLHVAHVPHRLRQVCRERRPESGGGTAVPRQYHGRRAVRCRS